MRAEPSGSARGRRALAWVTGVFLGAAFLAIGALIWFFGFALPHSSHRAKTAAGDQVRQAATIIASRIRERTGDGNLTAGDVTSLVAGIPARIVAARLGQDPVSILVEVHGVQSGPFGPVQAAGCYRFTVSKPLGRASQITGHRCPAGRNCG